MNTQLNTSSYSPRQVQRKARLNRKIESMTDSRLVDKMQQEDKVRLKAENLKYRAQKELIRRLSLRTVKELEEEERNRRIEEHARIGIVPYRAFLKDIPNNPNAMREGTPLDVKKERESILTLSPRIFAASPSYYGRVDTEIKEERDSILRLSPIIFRASPSYFGRPKGRTVPQWRPQDHSTPTKK